MLMKRLMTIVLVAGLASPVWTQDGPKWRDEFYHDFRGKPLPDGLTLFQVKNEQFIKTEPEGLRVTIPNDFIHPFGGIGVRTTFGIQGDFEIAATVEILEAEEPPPGGYGVGAILRLYKAEPSPDFVNLARLHRAGDKQVIMWEQSIGPLDEKRKITAGPSQCTDKLIRLRIKREGTTLHFSWAPGLAGDDFRKLRQFEFGGDDLRYAALVGVTGRQKCNLDARFLDLRIRSGGMVAAAAPVAAKAAPSSSEAERNYWWLLTVAVVVVLLGSGLALARLLRRRGRGTSAPAAVGAIAVQCPSCQKRLKVPATMTGKKVKCPACGVACEA